MTLAFPLALSEFWDQLPISGLSLDCAPQLEVSGTGAGQQLTRELAPALWRGTVTLGRLTPDEAADAMGLIDLARQSGASFLVSDLTRPWPQLDPYGSVIGANVVTVQTIGADRREITLAGLPPAYPLSRGDLIGVSWGSAPARFGLHRVVVASPAGPSGVTGPIEVTPAMPAQMAAPGPASLSRPAFKAIVVPGSVRAGTRRSHMVDGIAFDILQTLV